MSPTETMSTPTPDQARAALARLEARAKGTNLVSADEARQDVATLRAFIASLRSQVVAKDAEIESAKRGEAVAIQQRNEARDVEVEAKAQLAAAENRGFRAAAEWLERGWLDNPHVGYWLAEFTQDIRAEADRREGAAEKGERSEP